MTTNPDQNQNWIDEIFNQYRRPDMHFIEFVDGGGKKHHLEMFEVDTAKVKILAHHQAAIDKAVAEARKDEALNYDRFLMDDRTPPTEIYSNLTLWSGRRLRELDEEIAALSTPKERKK